MCFHGDSDRESFRRFGGVGNIRQLLTRSSSIIRRSPPMLQLGQEFGWAQTQQQKLILAPRMIQSMEILQLPILALQERIEQELQENPVLEPGTDQEEAAGAIV